MDAWLDKFVRNVSGELNSSISPATLWIPDQKCKACIGCALPFSLLVRRHHCRLCGHLFCAQCTKHFIPPLRTSPDQTWRRICKFCVQLPAASQLVGAPNIHLVQHHVHYQSLESLKTAAESIENQSCQSADVASGSRVLEPAGSQPVASAAAEAVPIVVATAATAATATTAAAAATTATATATSTATATATATAAAAAAATATTAAPTARPPPAGPSSSTYTKMRPIITSSQMTNSAQPSPVMNRQASLRANLAKEGALTWDIPPPLDDKLGGGELNGVDYEPAVVNMHRRLLDGVSDKHLAALTRQLLKGENVSNPEVWLPVIMQLAKEASGLLSPVSLSLSKDRDPRSYVKIKKLPEVGCPEDSVVVNGVVCKKNVALRRMRTQIEKPYIALLADSLEFARQANSLTGFDSVLDKEKDVLSKSVECVLDVKPDILVVHKNVARTVQEQLLARNITLVQNVKMDLLERLSRTTQAQIVQNVADLKPIHLGECGTFMVEPLGALNRCNSTVSVASVASAITAASIAASSQAPTTPPSITGKPVEPKLRDGSGTGQKTLMYFKGVPQRLGCTILLKGADARELRRVKRIVSFLTYAAYHANLENAFLADHMSVGLVAEACQNGLCDMDNSIDLLEHLAQLYIQASAARAYSIPSPHGIVSTSPYVWRDKTDVEIMHALSAPTPYSRGFRSQESGLLRRMTSVLYAEIIQGEMDAQARSLQSGGGDASTSTPQLKLDTSSTLESEPSTSNHMPAPSPCRSPLPVSAELAVAISNMPSEAASTSTAVHSSPPPAQPPTPGTRPETPVEGSPPELAATPSRLAPGSSKGVERPVSRPASPEFTDPLRRPPEGEVVEAPVEEEDTVSLAQSEPACAAPDLVRTESDPELVPTQSQDAGLLEIYKQQHVYITFSSRNPQKKVFCEPHLIRQIAFYGPEDLPLASFIIGSSPAYNKKCMRDDCGQGVAAHVKTIMHGSHRITMSFVSVSPTHKLAFDDRIWFWARPKDHGQTPLTTVRRTLLSREASSISLGRFLELCLCGHSLTVLNIPLNTQFVRYFGVGHAIMCMHQDYINTSRISMPATVMTYTVAGQLRWLHAEKEELLKEANSAFDWVLCILRGMAILQDNPDTCEFYNTACDQDRESLSDAIELTYAAAEREVLEMERKGGADWMSALVKGLMGLNKKRKQLALAQLVWAAFMKDPRFFERLTNVLKPGAAQGAPSSSTFAQHSSFKSHRPAYSMDNAVLLDGKPDLRSRSFQTMSMDAEQFDAALGHHRVDMSALGLPIMTVAGVSVTAVLELMLVAERSGAGLLAGARSIMQHVVAVSTQPSGTQGGTEEDSGEHADDQEQGDNHNMPPRSAGSERSSNGDDDNDDHTHGPEDGEDREHEHDSGDDEEQVPGSGWVYPCTSPAIDEHDEDNSELVPQSVGDEEGSASVGYEGDGNAVDEQPSLQSSPQETRYFSAAGTAALDTTVNEYGTPKSIQSGEEAEVTGPFRAKLEAESAKLDTHELSVEAESSDSESPGGSSQAESAKPAIREESDQAESAQASKEEQNVQAESAQRGKQEENVQAESEQPGKQEANVQAESAQQGNEAGSPQVTAVVSDEPSSGAQGSEASPQGMEVAAGAGQEGAGQEQAESQAGTAGVQEAELGTQAGTDQADPEGRVQSPEPTGTTMAEHTARAHSVPPGGHSNPFFDYSTSAAASTMPSNYAPLSLPNVVLPPSGPHAMTPTTSEGGSWKIHTQTHSTPNPIADAGPHSAPVPGMQTKHNMHLSSAATDPGLAAASFASLGLRPPKGVGGSLRNRTRVPGAMEIVQTAKLPMPGRTLLPVGLGDVMFPIFDGEPTSAVSYYLASDHYSKVLQDRRGQVLQSISRPDDKREEWEQLMLIKDREPSTLKSNFNDDSPGLPSEKATFQVTVHYPVRFGELRRKCIMGGEQAFLASLSRCKRWQNRGGKSNAYFARTRDERFIIKGLSKTEKQSLLEFAPSYFAHLAQVIKGKQTSSLAKIFGVFTVSMKPQSLGGSAAASPFKDMDIIVMENIFYDHQIKRIYDLKGSERARFSQEAESRPDDSGVVHLDDNLRRNSQTQPILVDTTSHHGMEAALWSDTDFLQGLGVMDYSLLVGEDKVNNKLVVALIDYIRTYTWDKQLETWVKSSGILGGGGKEPTIISPKQYMKRFRTAMQTYFTMVPNSSHLEPPLQPDASASNPTGQDANPAAAPSTT